MQFYAAQAESEYTKLSRFLNTSLLLGVFARSLGFPITIKVIILFNLAMLVGAVLIGKFLTNLGIVKFNSRLQNEQNPEITELVEFVRKQKNML